uniref:UDP-N-acetylglucosamine 2-epimerase (non-hydrolyzing) n=1 Tax=Curvibacter symbiont subsp. Hydra magnipapillata TaxID=667019 RepID=C9YDI5_CURXX|nr:UDP-N-acetylglucosamine 2-epimerase [Curvibacter putative symbiont of Hydra magnipapillata]
MSPRKKVLLVFGTRPEAIKMAPLCHALAACPEAFELTVCVSAQHRQMLDQVLRVFEIIPDIDLDLMRAGQDLFDVTSAVLLEMRGVLRSVSPDIVLVHGDTTTAMAAAMAGFYQGVPVGHVEAGLRTHDLRAPFPEEFNRQVIGKVASLHFAPTELSSQNLLREGVPAEQVLVTGNTVIDALQWVLARIAADPKRLQDVRQVIDSVLPFPWQSSRYVLITGHRRENFGDGFLQICQALVDLADANPQVHFVYPVHLNPNVQQPVMAMLSGRANVHLIAPLDYEPFAYLLQHCALVLTDSGGIQEEAPSLGKPVLVMRDVTERPEAVDAGTVRLVGANRTRIISHVQELLDDPQSYQSMSRAHNPYGDGKACARIVDMLRNI